MGQEDQDAWNSGSRRLKAASRCAVLMAAAFSASSTMAADELMRRETDGPVGADVAAFAVQEAFGHGNWAALDGLMGKYCDPREERLDDGRWKLSGVSLSLENFFDAYGEWEMMFAKIREWRLERPETTAADLVEAILWYSWAWSARGDGYASDVAPEGMSLFRERLQEAADVLKRSRDSAGSCPLYHEAWLRVLLGLGAEAELMDAAFEAGVGRFPDYMPLYYRRTIALLPWWGGSYEEIEDFTRESVERNLGKEGEALYTRIWLWVDTGQETSFDLFRDTPADWDRMKRGYELLVERHPRSGYLLNSFAAHACRAGDRESYGTVRRRITKPYYLPAWPTHLSIEICDLRLIGQPES
jgi:hypothetical protein